ncbi:MAG: ABC transporter ATP-binding protein [bacterium]
MKKKEIIDSIPVGNDPAARGDGILLEGVNLGKVFGGLAALEGVDLEVGEDEIVGLIGPNGAGKTTLFNCLTGITMPTTGTINFMNSDLVPKPMINLLAQLSKMSYFFMALSALWIFLMLGIYVPGVEYPMEFSIAMFGIGAFRVFVGAMLRKAVPWTRGVTLLFAVMDTVFAAFWMIKFSELYSDRMFFELINLEYILIPMALAMISYPAYFFVVLNRQDVKTLFGIFVRPDAITKLGMARTFQNIRLFPNLTVLDNVKLGRHCRTTSNYFSIVLRLKSQRLEEDETTQKAMEALQFVGLDWKADFIASSLPYGEQRRLEIARALATEPVLLLLDEPAAGMNPQETESLIKLVGKIRESGISVLLIEHDMKVIMKISERILVLDHGRKIAEGNPEAIRNDPRVVEAYLGSAYAAQ